MEVKRNGALIASLLIIAGIISCVVLWEYGKKVPQVFLAGIIPLIIGFVVFSFVTNRPSVHRSAIRQSKRIKRKPDKIISVHINKCRIVRSQYLDYDYKTFSYYIHHPSKIYDMHGSLKDRYKPKYPMMKLVYETHYQGKPIQFETWLINDIRKTRERLDKCKKQKKYKAKIYIKHTDKGYIEYYFDASFLTKRF